MDEDEVPVFRAPRSVPVSGETESEVSGWTTDTLREHTNVQINDLRTMLDERYATQTKALDAAFLAQQTAMQTALTAAEKAVQTALESAEKAVTKAEVAAEKRFEAVNEFRGQLSDQAALFLQRSEADIRFAALDEKVGSRADGNAARITDLERRANLISGENDGSHAVVNRIYAALAAATATIGLIVFLIVSLSTK